MCCMSYFECAMMDHKCRAYSVTCVGTMDHGCDFSSKNVYMSSRANYIFNAMHKLGSSPIVSEDFSTPGGITNEVSV